MSSLSDVVVSPGSSVQASFTAHRPAGVPPAADNPLRGAPAAPEGYIPSAAAEVSATPQAPAGYIPAGQVDETKLNEVPPDFVPAAQVDDKNVETLDQHLVGRTSNTIADEYAAYKMGGGNDPAVEAKYYEAHRKNAAKGNILDDADPRAPDTSPDPLTLAGHVSALNPLTGEALQMGTDMVEGTLTILNEAAKALGVNPMTARVDWKSGIRTADVSQVEADQVPNNILTIAAIKDTQAAEMLHNFASRVWNKVVANPEDSTTTQSERNSTYDSQLNRMVGFRMSEEGQRSGVLFDNGVDRDVVQSGEKSPLLDPTMYAPGMSGFKTARAGENLAARVLTGATDQTTLAEYLASKAGKMAAKPVGAASRGLTTVHEAMEAYPLLKGTTAMGIAAVMGGDVFQSGAAALLGANTRLHLFDGLAKIGTNLGDHLAGRLPPGPMGKLAVGFYRWATPEVAGIVHGQLMNMPFALGAGDEDGFKHAVMGGFVVHGAMRGGGGLVNGLDVGRNLWAERQTLPDTRLPVKGYKSDPVLDAAHANVTNSLSNSSSNYVQLVRNYFGDRAELYTLLPKDYNAAIDRMVADGQMSEGDAANAKNSQGVTHKITVDGETRNIALSKVTPQTPGLSVGHEAGHLLEMLLSPAELDHVYTQIAEAYGEIGLAKYKTNHERLLNAAGGNTVLSPREVVSEIFAEHVSAVLNSSPIEKLSDPKMNTADMSRTIYSLIGRGLEKIGAKVPELVDGGGSGPKTGLGIQPSAKIGNIIENVLQAHRLDNDSDPVYNTPSGKPPIRPDQRVLSTDKPAAKKPTGPAHPVTSDSPVGAVSLDTPTTPEGEVAGRHEENTHQAGEAPLPNIRVTPDQQNAHGEATPGQLARTNDHLNTAFAGPRNEINPVELAYQSAKADETGPNQVVRENQRRAADALEKAAQDAGQPNPLRNVYQKVTVPYGWVAGKAGQLFHAMSMDKVIHNTDLMQGWLHLNPEADPSGALKNYLASPQLGRDMQVYLRNQSNGWAGDGRELTVPSDTRPGTVTEKNPNYKPTKLSEQSAQTLNMLMGMEQPGKQTPGHDFARRFAEQNGVETQNVNNVTDTNPLRARLRLDHGFDPKVLNSAVEVLHTKRVLDMKERPDLQFRAGDTAMQRAGFMPDTSSGNPESRQVAEEYTRSAGFPVNPHNGYDTLPASKLREIADHFETEAKHDPNNPEVKASYDALIPETKAQYDAMVKAGVKAEPYMGKGEPYANSEEMMKDVRDNKHLWFFMTDKGFGNGAAEAHPMLEPSGVKINGHELLNNDLFRAVHDFYGHTQQGFQFGPRGEYNAWKEHSRMFSPEAQGALAAETLAQNAWVNFGPHLRAEDGHIPAQGEEGYVAPKDRPFAEQKAFVLPESLRSSDESPRFMPQYDGKKLEHSIPEKKLTIVHYGDSGMKEINSKQFGASGLTPGSELAGSPRHYWYVKGRENASDPVTGRGSKYTAEVSGSRIYDGDKDPLDYGSQVNRWKADDMLESAGYVGISRTGGRGRNTYRQVELFKPVKPDKGEPVKRASMMPSTDETPGFHSTLEDTLSKIPAKASRQQLEAALRDGVKEKGQTVARPVKAEEMRDVRDQAGRSFESFLKDNPDATREELLSFAQEHRVNVEEKTLGGETPKDLRSAQKSVKDAEARVAHTWTVLREKALEAGASQLDAANLQARLQRGDLAVKALPKDLQIHAQNMLDASGDCREARDHLNYVKEYAPPETKYNSYVLSGGENYREHVFTMPDKSPASKVSQDEYLEYSRLTELKDRTAEQESRHAELRAAVIDQNTRSVARYVSPYVSPHFPGIENYLAHARTNERAIPLSEARVAEMLARVKEAVPSAKSVESLGSGAAEVAVAKGLLSEQEATLLSQAKGWRNEFNPTPPDGPSGEKVLHAEEIQSDLHQKGRKEGYVSDLGPPDHAFYSYEENVGWIVYDKNGRTLMSAGGGPLKPEAEILQYARKRIAENGLPKSVGVPDAPFKKTWHELVFKNLLKKAAEGGKDFLSWTTGDQQAERYDLSKQISQITLKKTGRTRPKLGEWMGGPEGEAEHHLSAFDLDGRRVVDKPVTEAELPDLIGKEAAQKLLAQEWVPYSHETPNGMTVPQSQKQLSGLDLKVGGEGMKGFYDDLLPRFADKYLKKYGVKTEKLSIGVGSDAIVRGTGGWRNFRDGEGAYGPAFKTGDEAKKWGIENGKQDVVHAIRLTPELKQDILQNGQPKYMPAPRTDSPEFKKWFGESRVVDENGAPKVLYFGTKTPVDAFKKSRVGYGSTVFGGYEVERHGIFAAEDPGLAAEYAMSGDAKGESGMTQPLYMKIDHPLDTTRSDWYTDDLFGQVEQEAEKMGWRGFNTARKLGDVAGQGRVWELFDKDNHVDPADWVRLFKNLGFDGMRLFEHSSGDVKNTKSWVAFDPEQVKSATGNSGAFDPKNPDIRYMPAFAKNSVAEDLKRPGWAIVTGTQEANGAADAPANLKANAQLEAELKKSGASYKVVGGSYNNVDQGKSFLIQNISEADAAALGNKYNQESILTNRGFVYHDGSVAPMNHNTTVVGEEAKKQPGYSVLPDGTAFSAGIEWDKRVPPVEKSTLATEPGTPAPDAPVTSLKQDGPALHWEAKKGSSYMPEVDPSAFPTMTDEIFKRIAEDTSTLGAIHIDRMRVGEYKGTELQGGMFYAAIKANRDKGVVWAFNSPESASAVATRAAKNGGYVKLVLMKEGNVAGNKTFAKIWFDELRESIANGNLSEKTALREMNSIRARYAKSAMSSLRTDHAKWTSLDEAQQDIVSMPQMKRASTYFQRTKATTLAGDKVAYQALFAKNLSDRGFPDAQKIVEAVEEPAFKGVPAGAAVGIIRIDPVEADQPPLTAKSAGVPEHLSYGFVLRGHPVAKLEHYHVVDQTYPNLKNRLMSQAHTNYPLASSVPNKATAAGSLNFGPLAGATVKGGGLSDIRRP